METGHEIVKKLLVQEENNLRDSLDKSRANFMNSGNKGDNAEAVFRDFLSRYLPSTNRIGHGEVFSIEGLRSKQTDVVISNKLHVALTDNWELPQLFTIDSVQCAAEVKSVISDEDVLRDIYDKAKTFKNLFIEPIKGMEVRMSQGDAPRFVWRKPYFGFAFESKLSAGTIMQRLQSWDEEELRPIERPVLDGLFLLDRGAYFHLGTGSGSLYVEDGEGNQRREGYAGMSGDGQTLTGLLLWLSCVMHEISYPLHPIVHYLQPSKRTNRLRLNDEGTLIG